jgi:hypothetical protein
MEWDKDHPLVPFRNNEMQHYGGYGYNDNIEWVELQPFAAQSMEIVGFYRGAVSAAKIILEDENGLSYPMFLSDVVDLMRTANIFQGIVWGGIWQATKKGQNYGIKLVPDTSVVVNFDTPD